MNTLRNNMLSIHGALGQQWLDALSQTLGAFAQKYGLTDLQPVANMTFNYVARAQQGSKSVILKLGMNHQALHKEGVCLACFTEHGGPQLLASEAGMLLMQQLQPGTTLKSYYPQQEVAATNILCDLIKRLHAAAIPAKHDFYTLGQLLTTLDDELAIPGSILQAARKMRDGLLASSTAQVLLHGDLHHENILQQHNDWYAIDPKGFIGDPVYEVCCYMRNPSPDLVQHNNLADCIARRAEIISKQLDFPLQRINQWFFVSTVLSWAWGLQDNLDTRYLQAIVEVLM